jgi:hypothetical protein
MRPFIGSSYVESVPTSSITLGDGSVRDNVTRRPFLDLSPVHGGHSNGGSVTRASRFLIGLVTCFATHDGIPAVARASWRR